MKIVNRTTFLALPAGTVFAKYEPCVFGELSIKEDTWSNDYLVQYLTDTIASTGSGDALDQLQEAELAGTSLTMDFDCLGRDGCFDADQLFAVWEPADVQGLIARLQATLKVVP